MARQRSPIEVPGSLSRRHRGGTVHSQRPSARERRDRSGANASEAFDVAVRAVHVSEHRFGPRLPLQGGSRALCVVRIAQCVLDGIEPMGSTRVMACSARRPMCTPSLPEGSCTP
jgi:hypothetical protein